MNRRHSTPPDLPGFEFIEPLGSGGFADVYKYTQLGLGRQVAVKVLLSDLDPAMQASFEVEASVMAQLSNHPSIVSIYQSGVTPDGRPFLVLEYCPPPHLALRVRARPLSVAKALEVCVQLCGAVETAHRLGVLHRDIKPANILFTQFGRAALTDFGISVATTSAESGEGVGMSVPWAPPEQLTVGAPMGPSGDVYALAATLWTSLVGRSPFHVQGGANDAVGMAHRVRTLPVPPTRRPDVPESLERAIRTAMAKSAIDRYDSPLAFARALQGIQAELHQPVTTIDVLDEQIVESGAPEDAGGTRVSGFVSIDPESPPTSTPPPPAPVPWPAAPPSTFAPPAALAFNDAAGATQAGHINPSPSYDVGATVRPDSPPLAGGSPSSTPAAPGSAQSRPIGRLIGAAAVVLAVVGVVVWLGSRAPDATEQDTAPRTKPSPVDPVGPTGPLKPTKVKVKWSADALTVSWANSDPEAGDEYELHLQATPGKFTFDPANAVRTTKTRIELPSKGERCVTITTYRGTSPSEPEIGCDQVTR